MLKLKAMKKIQMKKIQLHATKLQLNKEKITSLTKENMNKVMGGERDEDAIISIAYGCAIPPPVSQNLRCQIRETRI